MRWLFILLFTTQAFAATSAVFSNADFRTDDLTKAGASWLAVENGRIAALGLGAVPPQWRQKTQIDLGGKIVFPSMTDAHAHLADLGAERDQVNLRLAKSEKEAAKLIADWMAANPTGGTVYGNGWDETNWTGGQLPTRATLDGLSPTRPIVLFRIDGHAAWVNRPALEKAGLWHIAIPPKGGQIIRGADGRPSGVLIDAAMDGLAKLQDTVTVEAMKRRYTLAVEEALSHGITGVHEAGATPLQLRAIRELLQEKKVQFRFYEMLSAKDPMDLERALATGLTINEFDGQFTVRTVKVFLDGAMGSGGAAFDAPYLDDLRNFGLMQMSGFELRGLVSKISARGFQVAVHAIGNRANREAVEAFEGALGFLTKSSRPRLEHAQVILPHDIARAARLGIIASMQPTHCTSDMKWVVSKIGARAASAYAWKSWLDAGGTLAFGSDAPVESINPWQGLFAALTRQTPQMTPPEGFFSEQRLSFTQAYNAFTTGAAHAAFAEKDQGSLAVGRYADFIVLSEDPAAMKPRALYDMKVDATYLAGNKVYERKTPTP